MASFRVQGFGRHHREHRCGSGGAAQGDGEEPHNPKPRTSQLTLIISEESEFADDAHQVIPTEDCYGLPLIQRQCGGFEHDY